MCFNQVISEAILGGIPTHHQHLNEVHGQALCDFYRFKHELARLAEKLAAEKAKTKAMASHIVTLQCQFKYAQASMTKKFVARLHEAQDQHKANVLHWHAER